MSMTEALRKLLRKMGGIPDSGDNSDELVSKIADAYSGGAGGGLPPYENEDINKVLMLSDSGQSETETVILIPEQTITTDTRGLANLTLDFTYWSTGQTVHLTVNDNTYDSIIGSDNRIQATVDGHDIKIGNIGSPSKNFLGYLNTTYTVSATIEVPVPIPAPTWATLAPFIINISEEIPDTETGETVFVVDKKPSEATAAFNRGCAIYVHFVDEYSPASDIELNNNGTVRSISSQYIEVTSDQVFSNRFLLISNLTTNEFDVLHSEHTYSGSTLVVYATGDMETGTTTLSNTWQEIHDALLSNGAVIASEDEGDVSVVKRASHITLDGIYSVVSDDGVYLALTADGYPSREDK